MSSHARWVVHSWGARSYTGDEKLDAVLADRYLLGGPNDSAIRQWWSWCDLHGAKSYGTEREAKAAMKGYHKRRGEHIEYVELPDG
jgi:hypothetical protein